MSAMTMIQALRSAMEVMLERDDNVVIYGQDVGYFGGVFRCTEGLQAKFGRSRVFDAPISEGGIVGSAIGMGAYGLRPVVEVQFADYFYPAYDQIVSEAARLRYRSAGDFSAPITIRMPCGGGIYGGQTHSQSPESLFTHVCGVRTVMPSNPRDAKGLLIASIENDDPVIFLEPKRLYNGPFDGHHDRPLVSWSAHPLGEVPEGHYVVPLESATVFRPGTDLTVITYGTMVFVSEAAARETGIDVEIIDLRSLWPLDLPTLVDSVRKTGRCVIVHEATRTSGFGAELTALMQEHCFHHLEAPSAARYPERNEQEAVPVTGVRRRIAQRMQDAMRRIPHFTYVEEIDVTELELLRVRLNEHWGGERAHLTLLPLLVRAVVLAVPRFPQINARFDDEAGVLTRHGAVHVGIATQTAAGLMVPVLRHAEARDLWSNATEIARLADAARAGRATRDELNGSTITVTSLGALGGIASTPIINAPEVAIVGVNRIVQRPVMRDGAVVARRMMNLSSSFDHRVVDGKLAAEFVQAVRASLECPALLFVV